MKKESIVALAMAICMTCIMGILLLYINQQPQALLINNARLMYADSNKISQHFSTSFNQQFQNVYCKTISDTPICNLLKSTPPDLLAISIFKSIHATAYGWPKIEMLAKGNFQMEYTIQSRKNFNLILYGHKNKDCLVFDSIGNVSELIKNKPQFTTFLMQ